ncbi:MAG: PA14 domain-containing protein, partial [Chloroflexota bacterium]
KELVNLALRELIQRKERKEILRLKGKLHWEGDLEELRRSRFDDPAGMTVQLTAGPNAGWHFENWTGGATGSAVTNHIVNKSGAVTAVFLENSLILPPSTPPPPPASDWIQTFFLDRNLGTPCGTPRSESDVYMFRDSDAGWSPPQGCPGAESSWSVSMVRTNAYFEGGQYSFGLFYDDRARLYIDDNLVIDGWSANQHYKGYSLTSGEHKLRLDYKNVDGQAILGLWWRGPGALPGIGEGKDPAQWWVKFWGNQSQWGDTVGFRSEGTGFLDRDWFDAGPGFGLPVDHFSTSYERTLGFECGTYQFHLKSDDGSRLFVDGTLVPELDHWSAITWDDTADVTLTNADHTLRVDQFDKDGNASIDLEWSKVASCQPDIPARTANLVASDGSYTNKVSLSWDTVSDAAYYQVYRNTVNSINGATLLNSPVTPGFDDSSALPGITYYYRVKACRDTTCSWFSLANTGWRKLKPPAFLQASDGAYPDKIILNWTASSGATIYRVYSSTTRAGMKTLLGRVKATTFVDTNASPGVTYFYRIKACKGARCSWFSLANPGWSQLERPTSLQASDGTYTDRISLTWASTAGATSYRVYRSASRTGARILLGKTGDTGLDDISATPGLLYYYRVKACRVPRCSNFSMANSGWRSP